MLRVCGRWGLSPLHTDANALANVPYVGTFARLLVPWCSGLAYVPVKDEIAGSNPVGTASQSQMREPSDEGGPRGFWPRRSGLCGICAGSPHGPLPAPSVAR